MKIHTKDYEYKNIAEFIHDGFNGFKTGQCKSVACAATFAIPFFTLLCMMVAAMYMLWICAGVNCYLI